MSFSFAENTRAPSLIYSRVMAIYDLTAGKIKDDSGRLTSENIAAAVAEALNRYSSVRPWLLVRDQVAPGGHDIDLPLDWYPGFSEVLSIEHPIGSVPEKLLPRGSWRMYATPDGELIRLTSSIPQGNSLRITFTVLHSEDSVPAGDQETVANLAASICCLQLAAIYGSAMDSTLQADTVDHQSKTDQYRRLAKEYEGRYKAALGLKDGDTVSPSMVVAPPPARRRRALR